MTIVINITVTVSTIGKRACHFMLLNGYCYVLNRSVEYILISFMKIYFDNFQEILYN